MDQQGRGERMNVYVVMSDTPRSDLGNIYSAYLSKREADEQTEYLNDMDNFNTYHVEKLEVEE